MKKWYAFKETKFLCQRIPTPRPALKIVLKDAWQVEQGTLSSKETSTVEGNLFQIDLRIQKHPQNTVLQDQGRMTKIRGLVNKIRTEYRTESVITDLDKTKKFNRFSEESKDKFKDGERSNCTDWEKFPRKHNARHAPSSGQWDCFFCTCGLCLMPSSEQKRLINSQFEILPVPCYIVKTDCSRGAWRRPTERYKGKRIGEEP